MAKTNVAKKGASTRRPRRKTEEIVERIAEAASFEFERNGYAGTTTAAIAKRAGVAEPLIFNHFGSKAGLFRNVIFTPLDRHFLEFKGSHLIDKSDKEGLREGSHEYIRELQGFIEQHSRMLTSMVALQLYESEAEHRMENIKGLEEFFSRTTAAVMTRLDKPPKVEIHVLSRIAFATVLSSVIFKDWLFPAEKVAEEVLNEAICDFVMEGFNANA